MAPPSDNPEPGSLNVTHLGNQQCMFNWIWCERKQALTENNKNVPHPALQEISERDTERERERERERETKKSDHHFTFH